MILMVSLLPLLQIGLKRMFDYFCTTQESFNSLLKTLDPFNSSEPDVFWNRRIIATRSSECWPQRLRPFAKHLVLGWIDSLTRNARI